MSVSYHERIAGFVKNMMAQPIKMDTTELLNERHDIDYRFKRSALKGSEDDKGLKELNNGKHLRFKSTPLERVKENIEQNKMLNCEPALAI